METETFGFSGTGNIHLMEAILRGRPPAEPTSCRVTRTAGPIRKIILSVVRLENDYFIKSAVGAKQASTGGRFSYAGKKDIYMYVYIRSYRILRRGVKVLRVNNGFSFR